MSTLCAIDISRDEATLVTAIATKNGLIRLLSKKSLIIPSTLAEAEQLLAEANGVEATIVDTTLDTTPDLLPVKEGRFARRSREKVRLSSVVSHEVDLALATLAPDQVLYEYLSLPFNDEKKLDQIVPLQIQDLVPFDIDTFVVDSIVVGHRADGQYEILSGLIPQSEVKHALERLGTVGANPKVLSTRASAAALLPKLCSEILKGSFSLLLFGEAHVSLAIFVDDELRLLREFSHARETPKTMVDQLGQQLSDESLFKDIRCSIARACLDYEVNLERIYVVGDEDFVQKLKSRSELPLHALDLTKHIANDSTTDFNANEVPWALGLFASEIHKAPTLPLFSKQRTHQLELIDFRRGAFAFKPALGHLITALKDEAEWIICGALALVIWFVSSFYVSAQNVSQIDREIERQVQLVLPGTFLPYRREITALDEKITELTTQLKEMGSLSSLSPLESIRNLSDAIKPEIDISIETLKIGAEGISFAGSVSDIPSVGRLKSILESFSNVYCKSNVESKGRGSGSTRVRFEADAQYCEATGLGTADSGS